MTKPLRQKKRSTARKLSGKLFVDAGICRVATRTAATPRSASSNWKRCCLAGVGIRTKCSDPGKVSECVPTLLVATVVDVFMAIIQAVTAYLRQNENR